MCAALGVSSSILLSDGSCFGLYFLVTGPPGAIQRPERVVWLLEGTSSLFS